MAVDNDYTKALLHMNGADASTTFTDESGKTWSAVGNAQIDTAQSKFGGASGLFDGVVDYLESAASVDWQGFGTTALSFTVDFWTKVNSATDTAFVAQVADANNFWQFDRLTASSTLNFRLRVGGVDVVSLAGTNFFTDTNWHHVALVKAGGVSAADYYLFKDGTQISTVNDNSTGAFSGVLRVGGGGGAGFGSLNGWIDEFRLSNGVARWTANFTPPTSEYVPFSGWVMVM